MRTVGCPVRDPVLSVQDMCVVNFGDLTRRAVNHILAAGRLTLLLL